jgi:hypothetical protein
MAQNSLIKSFESLNLIVKLVLIFFFGWIIGGVYRIIRYTETKNITTLVIGLLGLFTCIGNFVIEVVDFVSELLNNKIEYLVEI